MNRYFLFLLLASALSATVLHAADVTRLHDGWRLQSACDLQASGDTISGPDFSTNGWIGATVPTTVLAAQVAAGLFPDPYFGDNLRKIPGTSYPVGENFANLPMPADSPYRCGWWYRDAFTAPQVTAAGRRFWLHFGGINYRAEIWLNGHKIADSGQIAGAYRTYDLDVSGILKPGEGNVLAVEVFAPTEKDLGINWVDWNPAPPDKDMGLWGDVDLTTTGAVALRSPMVVTHLPEENLQIAELTVEAQVQNASDKDVQGAVSGSTAGVTFEQAVHLAAHEERTVAFTPEQFPQLRIHNPRLWWPWQMGDPHLETMTMTFSSQGHATDEKTIEFGMREITSEYAANGGGRLFRINGKPILIRGGGWSQDMLLRTNPDRLREQFRMVRDMNLNALRLEGKLETDDFFNLADRNGILVMLGWCCCDHWERWQTWTPDDLNIATASLRSQLLRLRHHASLLVWLNGSDNPPPANVEKAYLDVERATHWPNPTLSSATERPTSVSGESGVKMTGPYDYVEPSYWYVDHHYGGAWGFNTETSPGPAIPSLASRRKFLPDPNVWPLSPDWSLHLGGGEFRNLRVLDAAMSAIYSPPTSAAGYERMAQTMAYDSERAMFESYSRNKYVSTGVIQWMLNNAWPSMIWHLYDYNLDADAGYFAVKKACEPLHIQYSYDDQSVVVINSTYHPVSDLHASVDIHGIGWNELYSATAQLTATADSAQRILVLPGSLSSGTERILFIDLTLTDSGGHLVSHNFYWVPYTLTTFDWSETDYTHTPPERYPDLTALTRLPPARVAARAEIAGTQHTREIHLQLENNSSALAFQLRAAVRSASGDLVAPVFWSDNWIELAPGASTTLTARLPDDAPVKSVIQVEGWNIQPVIVTPVRAAETPAQR